MAPDCGETPPDEEPSSDTDEWPEDGEMSPQRRRSISFGIPKERPVSSEESKGGGGEKGDESESVSVSVSEVEVPDVSGHVRQRAMSSSSTSSKGEANQGNKAGTNLEVGSERRGSDPSRRAGGFGALPQAASITQDVRKNMVRRLSHSGSRALPPAVAGPAGLVDHRGLWERHRTSTGRKRVGSGMRSGGRELPAAVSHVGVRGVGDTGQPIPDGFDGSDSLPPSGLKPHTRPSPVSNYLEGGGAPLSTQTMRVRRGIATTGATKLAQHRRDTTLDHPSYTGSIVEYEALASPPESPVEMKEGYLQGSRVKQPTPVKLSTGIPAGWGLPNPNANANATTNPKWDQAGISRQQASPSEVNPSVSASLSPGKAHLFGGSGSMVTVSKLKDGSREFPKRGEYRQQDVVREYSKRDGVESRHQERQREFPLEEEMALGGGRQGLVMMRSIGGARRRLSLDKEHNLNSNPDSNRAVRSSSRSHGAESPNPGFNPNLNPNSNPNPNPN